VRTRRRERSTSAQSGGGPGCVDTSATR
jgi:hypothetical protein